MNVVKCPNPSCTFQFDATVVPPGAVIACPQCRLQFQLPAATAPVNVEPLDADVEPIFDEEDDDRPPRRHDRDRDRDRDDDPPPSAVRRRKAESPPRRGLGGTAALIAVVVAGFALVCCGGVVGAGYLFGWFRGPVSDSKDYAYSEYGIGFNGPGDGWAKDDATRDALKVNLASFKHADPEGYVAVQARKATAAPNAGDLVAQVKETLGRQFEDVDETLTPEAVTLFGQPAERYAFTGRYLPTDKGCRGEVYAANVRNTLVWVYTWADRDRYDDLAPAFDRFRAGLKLDTTKPVEKAPRTRAEFRTNSGLYLLTDTEGQWKKQDGPTTQDKAADLWLKGGMRSPTGAAVGGKQAEADLVVAVLAPEGDAKEQARAHILEQFLDGAEVNEQVGEPGGEAPPDGPVPPSTAVVRMTMKYPDSTGSADKLVVFTTLDAGGKRVVVYAHCPVKQAVYWEQRLMRLVGSVKGLK